MLLWKHITLDLNRYESCCNTKTVNKIANHLRQSNQNMLSMDSLSASILLNLKLKSAFVRYSIQASSASDTRILYGPEKLLDDLDTCREIGEIAGVVQKALQLPSIVAIGILNKQSKK